MLRSILSVCGSLGSLIARVMLVVATIIGMFWFGYNAMTVPFRMGGARWLAGALACAAVFVLLVRARRSRDERPADDDR